MCGDHVHACVRIPPKLAVSDVMGYVKGKSAMVLRDRHPEWGKVVGRGKTFWARGHCVSAVGLNEGPSGATSPSRRTAAGSSRERCERAPLGACR